MRYLVLNVIVSDCLVYYSIHSCSHVKVCSNTVQVDKLPLTGGSNLFLQFGDGENYHQIMSVCASVSEWVRHHRGVTPVDAM